MARPRGRPALPRGAALVGSQPLHSKCAEYLAELAEGGTHLVFDRLLAATAAATGVACLVTTDAGFAHVPEEELTLYADAGRVRSCRDKRTNPRRRQ